MKEITYWIVGMMVALIGLGISLFYQGQALLEPNDKEKLGKQLVGYGKLFFILSVIYIVGYFIIVYVI